MKRLCNKMKVSIDVAHDIRKIICEDLCNATYNTSSSTRKSAMCNFEITPVLCAHLHTCKCVGEGSRHFSAFHFISIGNCTSNYQLPYS